jgi:DNA-binding transcriptional ArsR family regulator
MLTLTISKIKILKLLKRSPLSNNEICKILGRAKSTISEHIKNLIYHNLIIREEKNLKITNYGLDLYKKSSEFLTEQTNKVTSFPVGGHNIAEPIPNENKKKQISHKEGLKVLDSEEELFKDLDKNDGLDSEGVTTFPVGGHNLTEPVTELGLVTGHSFSDAKQKKKKNMARLSGIRFHVLQSLWDCQKKGIQPTYGILTKKYRLTKRQAEHHRKGLIKLKLIKSDSFSLTKEGEKLVKTPNYFPVIYGREGVTIHNELQKTENIKKSQFEFEGRMHNYIIRVEILKEPKNKDWYLNKWGSQKGMMRGKAKKQIWFSRHYDDVYLLYTHKNIILRFPEKKYKDINIGLSELNIIAGDICKKLQYENEGLELGKLQVISQQSIGIQNTPISKMAQENNYSYKESSKNPHSIEIDHSRGSAETEFTHAETAHLDYVRYVNHTKDIISNVNVAKISEIQNTINEVIKTQQMYIYQNQNSINQINITQKETIENMSIMAKSIASLSQLMTMPLLTGQNQKQDSSCDIDPENSNLYQ